MSQFRCVEPEQQVNRHYIQRISQIQLSDESYIILTNKPTYGYMHPIVCSHVSILAENDTKQVTTQVKRTLLKI